MPACQARMVLFPRASAGWLAAALSKGRTEAGSLFMRTSTGTSTKTESRSEPCHVSQAFTRTSLATGSPSSTAATHSTCGTTRRGSIDLGWSRRRAGRRSSGRLCPASFARGQSPSCIESGRAFRATPGPARAMDRLELSTPRNTSESPTKPLIGVFDLKIEKLHGSLSGMRQMPISLACEL